MTRAKKPAAAPKKPTIKAQLESFATYVEQMTPEWLMQHEAMATVIMDRFHEKDDDGNYKASIAEQVTALTKLCLSRGGMMRFAAVREQVAQERGVGKYLEKGEQTHNHLTLNFAPGMTADQKKSLEAIYLAGLNGKSVTALPEPQREYIETVPV